MIKVDGKEIKINRANAVVSEMDKAYCSLVKEILDKGIRTENRTGIDTISIAGWYYKFDLSKGFPIAESKKIIVKNCASEICWIHQAQSNVVKWLTDRDNHVWDLWKIDEDGIYRTYEQGENAVYDPERLVPLYQPVRNLMTGKVEKLPMLDKYGKQIMVKSKDLIDGKTNPRTIKTALWYGKDKAGTIGKAYGAINSMTLAPQRVQSTIKTEPTDRRLVINLWQDQYLVEAVLPSCVWSIEFKVSPDGKLHGFVHQRSADVPLGLPFNISQYAIFLSMMAKACGLEPGTLSWSIMDAHIYVNQIDGINKQYRRYEYMEEYSKFIQEKSDDDIEMYYNSHVDLYNKVHEYASRLLKENIDNLKVSEIVTKLSKIDKNIANDYEEAFERKIAFEHMLTREIPELELADRDDFFEFSTDYAKKGDAYLNENPIGNKDIVLKRYKPTPFISMPIAQ